MSEQIKFFAARYDWRAKAVHARGPKPSRATVSGSYFDADDAVIIWESLLTGRIRDDIARSEPRMVADWVNDGSAVFALSDQLLACLIDAEPLRLREIAEGWSAELIRDGDDLDAPSALGVLLGVAELAREASNAGHRVYCWVSG